MHKHRNLRMLTSILSDLPVIRGETVSEFCNFAKNGAISLNVEMLLLHIVVLWNNYMPYNYMDDAYKRLIKLCV